MSTTDEKREDKTYEILFKSLKIAHENHVPWSCGWCMRRAPSDFPTLIEVDKMKADIVALEKQVDGTLAEENRVLKEKNEQLRQMLTTYLR